MELRIKSALLTAATLSLGVVGFAGAPAPDATAPMTASEKALHVLNRLGFGPRPGDVDRVLAMGVPAWVDRQLNPAGISDDAAAAAVKRFPTLAMTTAELVEKFELPLREAASQLRQAAALSATITSSLERGTKKSHDCLVVTGRRPVSVWRQTKITMKTTQRENVRLQPSV